VPQQLLNRADVRPALKGVAKLWRKVCELARLAIPTRTTAALMALLKLGNMLLRRFGLKADAPNPAMTSLFQLGRHWRWVADLRRSE